MPKVPPGATPASAEPHRARLLAESFGEDPERYHRTRPRYPQALVDRIIAASPGRQVLDVGIGTGVSARHFADAGCEVLGVEVDPRMAEFARGQGFEVEVARFEDWDPAGRTVDAVLAGQTWHWVEPVAGAAKAAASLRPGGRIAVFWNVQQVPPELARAFAEAYQRALPDSPFGGGQGNPLDAYERICARAADGIRSTGAFEEPERWRVDWEQRYTTGEWLELVPTFGGHSLFPRPALQQLMSDMAEAIEARGGSFTMGYACVAVTATTLLGAVSAAQ
jgi:SAM-dependent methyltransferase